MIAAGYGNTRISRLEDSSRRLVAEDRALSWLLKRTGAPTRVTRKRFLSAPRLLESCPIMPFPASTSTSFLNRCPNIRGPVDIQAADTPELFQVVQVAAKLYHVVSAPTCEGSPPVQPANHPPRRRSTKRGLGGPGQPGIGEPMFLQRQVLFLAEQAHLPLQQRDQVLQLGRFASWVVSLVAPICCFRRRRTSPSSRW